MRALGLAVVAALVVVAGPAAAAEPQGVIAVLDTGINVYHEAFRDDSRLAQRHPSTYIRGYPKDAIALRVSLDEPSYGAAIRADCDRVWSKIVPDTLYWVPGTKIVGAISFAQPSPIDCDDLRPPFPEQGRILDPHGHGTMTASRAASKDYGGCPACRVVAVQMGGNVAARWTGAVRWAGDNARWIDAQSNSWGPTLPVWDPTGRAGFFAADSELVRTAEAAARKHLAFWGSGNGAAFRGGFAGHPTLLVPHLTPSVVMVGGHDSGYVVTWPGFSPHVVADVCLSPAARPDSTSEYDTGGSGTSASTPFAAGRAVATLLKARAIGGDRSTGVDDGIVARGARHVERGPLADGDLTLEEWKRLVLLTATERPDRQREDGPACDPVTGQGGYSATPVSWSDVPAAFPEYVAIGYGSLDASSGRRAADVLHGRTPLPERADTDAYFAADRGARSAMYDVYTRP